MIPAEEIQATEMLLLLGNESELIMPPEYSDNRKARHFREQALDYFQSIYNREVSDVLVPYVAINYFDRVISKLQAPPTVLFNKRENFNLFLISCLSISWKLRVNNFDINKFLLDRGLKFGNKGLMRMEMSILHALDWRMKQTVPFRFVPYFLHFLTLPRGFTRLPVHKIIVWTQADIRFTKFRPSAVAASAILCASAKLFPDDSNDFRRLILSRYALFDSAIENELAECVELIEGTYQNKMNTLMIAKGSSNDGVGTSQPLNLAPVEASTSVPPGSRTSQSSSPGDGKQSVEEGSHRQGKEPVAEEASEAIRGIQTAPEQSSSPGDGRESLEEGSHRQGKEPVAEEASSATGEIQTAPKQSSTTGDDGRESPEKRSHRPGREPIDEESSEAIRKLQMAPNQSSSKSDDDREGVEEGFCSLGKAPMVEIEEPELAVVDNLMMDFELGWDDQNPYSHGYGMCSLFDALARCWPIPIFEAQEQTLEWLRGSWEWLLNLPELIGIPNRQAAHRPWESFHEADSSSSSDPVSFRIRDLAQRRS